MALGGDAQRYRLRALECRQKAEMTNEPKARASWHELERVRLELAVRVDAEDKPRRQPARQNHAEVLTAPHRIAKDVQGFQAVIHLAELSNDRSVS
jgi:hypothetical protein